MGSSRCRLIRIRCISSDRTIHLVRDYRRRQMMPHSKNQLLARLSAEQLAHFSSDLKVVALRQGELIADKHGNVQKVYFPHSGIISCIVEMKGGHAMQTGMIGNDGAFGAAQ